MRHRRMSRIQTYEAYAEALGFELDIYFKDEASGERYEYIVDACRAKDITMERLAELLGVDVSNAKRFVRKQLAGNAYETKALVRYAEVLGMEFVIEVKSI